MTTAVFIDGAFFVKRLRHYSHQKPSTQFIKPNHAIGFLFDKVKMLGIKNGQMTA